MPSLVFQWFPLCEFSLFGTPQVSSLVVQGLGVSASPKAQGLVSSFAWVYIFFSASQVLLSAVNWYSACISVSEVVFLMYRWGEMYSMITYSSTILLSPIKPFNSPYSLTYLLPSLFLPGLLDLLFVYVVLFPRLLCPIPLYLNTFGNSLPGSHLTLVGTLSQAK